MVEKDFKPLTDDILFREIFGNPDNSEFLQMLLDDFFEENQEILDVRVEHYLPKLSYREKNSRSDIVLELDTCIIILEIYTKFTLEGLKKTLTYIGKKDGSQTKMGKKYRINKQVKCICIVENATIPLKKEWLQRYSFQEENFELTDEIEWYIVNLDKVKEIPYNEGESNFLTDMRYIGAKSEKERKEIERKKSMFGRIGRKIKHFLDEKELDREFSLKNKWLMEGREDGIEIGLKKGEELGLKRGEELGLKKGKKLVQERELEFKKEKQQIANNMLKENIDIDTITKITGLPIETIEKMRY